MRRFKIMSVAFCHWFDSFLNFSFFYAPDWQKWFLDDERTLHRSDTCISNFTIVGWVCCLLTFLEYGIFNSYFVPNPYHQDCQFHKIKRFSFHYAVHMPSSVLGSLQQKSAEVFCQPGNKKVDILKKNSNPEDLHEPFNKHLWSLIWIAKSQCDKLELPIYGNESFACNWTSKNA